MAIWVAFAVAALAGTLHMLVTSLDAADEAAQRLRNTVHKMTMHLDGMVEDHDGTAWDDRDEESE